MADVFKPLTIEQAEDIIRVENDSVHILVNGHWLKAENVYITDVPPIERKEPQYMMRISLNSKQYL